jgi:pimeloyl-ACP methyl ester carboxylesterase
MNCSLQTSIKKWSIAITTVFMISSCGKESPKTVSSFDGVPISYEVHGSGKPTLVFVHGWSCDRSYWDAQRIPLSKQYQIVTLDLAGHGQSGMGREAWTIASYGEDVAAVVKELGLEDAILIGHSMGGDVIVEAARHLPKRIKGLVMVDTYKKLGAPRTPEVVQAFIAPFRKNFREEVQSLVRSMFPADADRALVERVAFDMSSAPPAVALPSMESSITNDSKITGTLQEIRIPVVAFNPDNTPTDHDSMERYGVAVVIMTGVGHFLMMENPEVFNRKLVEVIENLGSENS